MSIAATKRDEIIEIASELFYTQGFGATGIKQIIDAAGIAKGTFYTHFASKEQLGVAWLTNRHHVWNAWLETSLTTIDGSTNKLSACFQFLKDWLQESNFRGCAFLNTMAETPDCENSMRAVVTQHKQQLLEKFQQLTSEHFSGIPLSPDSAIQHGSTIYLLFEGALVESQNFQDTWPVDAALTQVHQILNSKAA
ncbi:TetR/AcrR family transcriptional regulator [Rubritalea profundi]|uniref:HTH tetR-type domain-containing protein n=1 Tax=Rubritalea profundi TaxID=1658618 RepID=A0A2S7U2C2_9BACT|nr:TetR/AcrR family transcriptional regulator [Rubritalea profundi]PQJ29139.1 hypothetical protein BSZ32_11985 [Rubritalea profundi]